jgi:hypothetical protein
MPDHPGMNWLRYRSRPMAGLVLLALGVGILVQASGFADHYEFTPDATGVGLGALLVGASVLVFRKVI